MKTERFSEDVQRYLFKINDIALVKPKIENRDKNYAKQEMSEETRETLCETLGNLRGNRGKYVEN